MRKKTETKPPASEPAVKVNVANRNETVLARVPQGYDTQINIRFVPGRDFRLIPDVLGCQPRQGARRRETDPVDLPITFPEGLIIKLKDANRKVIDWLAQDPVNAQLFMTRPVQALSRAGVDLTRSEQKTLERAHRAVYEARVIAPGVKVVALSATAHPTGNVGGLKPGTRLKDRREEGCGCEPKGKE